MPIFRWVALHLLLLTSSVLHAQTSGRSWLNIRSEHFRVITDVEEKRGVEIARRCEQMRAVFSTLMPQASVHDPAPLLILALHGQQEVDDVGFPQNRNMRHAGVFIPGADANFIVLDATRDPWHTVFHEYAHELLNANSSSATQTWFEEGFAEYFSTISDSKSDAKLGQVPLEELQFLRNKGKLMRLAELVSITQNSRAYIESGPMQATFYAQSWLLVHYLFDHQLIGRAQSLFAMMNNGMSLDEAVPAAFGIARKTLEDDLLAYAEGQEFRYFSFPLTALQPGKIEVMALSEESALALELEASWRTRRQHAPSETANYADKYRAILAREPANADAMRGLSAMLFESGQYKEALRCLQHVIPAAGDARDFRAMSQLLDKVESNGPPSELQSSSEHEAEAALALDPYYADAYYLRARAQTRRGQINSALDLMRKAVALSPRTDAYKLELANIELRNRDYSSATALLRQLIRCPDPEIAHKAATVLSSNAIAMQMSAQ